MSEKQGRCLGLVGGLGPGATVYYYQALLRAHAARGVRPDIVIVHADVGQVMGLVGHNDLEGLAVYLAGFIARLEQAGAEIAAIPAITPHGCMPMLRPLTRLPVLEIVDAVRSDLVRRGMRRIALFGTRFTVESDMFGQLADFDIVRPRSDEAEAIYRVYAELVAAGIGTEAQAETLREIAARVIARDQVDAVVLAGTELALIVDGASAGYPTIDCAALHVEALADYASDIGEPQNRY